MADEIFSGIAPDAPSFDQPLINGPIVDEHPIVEDRLHIVSSESTSCDREHYTAPALSLEHPLRPGLYFVGDRGHRTEEIGDVYVWERRWANIPRSFTRALGTYAYRFPGLQGGSGGASPVAITALSPSTVPSNGYIPAPVFTAAAHGFAVGARLSLSLSFSGLGTTVLATVTITAVTTNTFTSTGLLVFVVRGGTPPAATFSSGSATVFTPYREPKTLPADAVEVFSYALPGVTAGIATSADFRPDDLFQPIVTATGEETDILAVGTTPTASDYRAQMAAGAYLVVESGIRPYLGDILERRTVLVRYT